MYPYIHIHIYIYISIYPYGYNVFHRPHQVCSSILYVHVSEILCCACFPAVVHVSQKLCTCHRSCARFTSPPITFVFNCIYTERILNSKSIGATKHVFPIHIYSMIERYSKIHHTFISTPVHSVIDYKDSNNSSYNYNL